MVFSYGEFNFEVSGRTCSLKSPVLSIKYSGKGIIPSIAKDGAKRYIVTKISSYCFSNCIGLNSISFPDTLKDIDTNILYNTSVKTLFIPKSVRRITGAAFSGVFNLETVIFEPGSRVSIIGGSVFAWCEKLQIIILPPSIRSIDSYMFHGTSSTKSVYYCGSNELTDTKLFESPCSTFDVTVYVTNKYPTGKLIGGKNKIVTNLEKCAPYYEVFDNRITCKNSRRVLKMSCTFIVILTMK